MATCPRCMLTGGKSHHFEKLGTFTAPQAASPVSIFYTNPAQTIEVLDAPEAPQWWMAHFEATRPNKWIWIFDCQHTSNSQLMSIQSAKRLMNIMYETHKDTLQGIYVLQPSWAMKTFLQILSPFVKKDVRHRLHIYSHGLLDTVAKFQALGIKGQELQTLMKVLQTTPSLEHTRSKTVL
jgi:hypothetical protein